MSLTAHLLFARPTRLPQGRVYTHNPDARRLAALTAGQQDNAARNTATKQANVERIYNAVTEGAGTFVAISERTGLSIATVKKLLTELEDWPGGPRIVRAKGQRHHFKALP